MKLTFTVYGKQIPQGSKRTVPIYRAGKPVMKGNRTLTRVADDNPGLPAWRQEIAHAARYAYDGEPMPGPFALTVQIVRPRPRGHFGTGRNADRLKPSAPAFPTSAPDTLKLARAVEDALENVLWLNDAQIVRHILSKNWGKEYAIHVTVESIDGAANAAGGE
ncbi:unnamed protein product [marine sediment metagenome]|uniref:Uncharacterized protein n=1 Tax=marine sediment metagenome TaxID=412755 RepID=X0WTL0_9ZZZZ